jgi:hypothetical protein
MIEIGRDSLRLFVMARLGESVRDEKFFSSCITLEFTNVALKL